VDLDDPRRRLVGPALDLQDFRFEPEGLDIDSVPGELAVDGRGGRVIGGQQRLAPVQRPCGG
jgi:hypothetical protein